MKKIFVVDDEKDILELVALHLERAGFDYKCFNKGSDLFLALNNELPRLVILDLMLPDMDGIEICRKIRSGHKDSKVPIIMLTAKVEETDRIIGLELGADDYVTKPFSPRELIARVKAVLRRYEDPPDINDGYPISLDRDRYEVRVYGELVELTTTEFKILSLLISRPGWVFSREVILDELWGTEKFVTDRTVDVHIRHLRKKIKKAASHIKNIRGVGYKYTK